MKLRFFVDVNIKVFPLVKKYKLEVPPPGTVIILPKRFFVSLNNCKSAYFFYISKDLIGMQRCKFYDLVSNSYISELYINFSQFITFLNELNNSLST